MDKVVSIKFVCVYEQFLLPRIHYLYVLHILDWSKLATEANVGSVFKRK